MAESETKTPEKPKRPKKPKPPKVPKSGPGGKRRLRLGARAVASYVLIAVGLALILFAGLYALVDYPWQILFNGPETFKTDTLPDPEPPVLDGAAVTYNPAAVTEMPDEPAEDLPGADLPGADLPGADLPDADPTESPALRRGPPVVCQVIGAVKIPKLGLSVNLMDDVTQTHLRLGAGFVRGTALPGRPGNCSIAGHRVTARMHPFRHLDKMAAGDYVFVKYAEHTYVYETTETFVVSNKDRWIMDPVPSERYLLTLITCHPVGSARQRLILRARLIEIDGMTPQEFYAPEVPETPEGSDTPADAGASVDASAPPAPDTPADVGVSVDASAPPTPDTSPTPGAPDAGVSPDRDAPSPQVGATPGSGPPAEATESPPGAETPPPDGGVL